MNNFNLNPTAFSFLALQPEKLTNSCGLAWIDDSFHLQGNNYYIYTCHSCQAKQIKKGTKPPADFNWGGHHD